MPDAICFLIDGAICEVPQADSGMTLLQFLRERLRKTGTKEGCAEGDCGACTVLVGEAQAAQIKWRSVNACILPVAMLDGRALTTVESLANGDRLHPVQLAMVEQNASQCGFCTPGFVMSIVAWMMGAAGTDIAPKDAIAGNLCRCTGYGPILAAMKSSAPLAAYADPRRVSDEQRDSSILQSLAEIKREKSLALKWRDPVTGAEMRWFAPRSTVELIKLLANFPNAQLVAGATDIGVRIAKFDQAPDTAIFLGELTALQFIIETDLELRIGAGVRLVDAFEPLSRLCNELGELILRFGAVQIRNSATVVGNIANGSPVGDLLPALIMLGATINIRSPVSVRQVSIEDYFLSYYKQDISPGEFIESVIIPRPSQNVHCKISKFTKRSDCDISAVCGAIAIEIAHDKIVNARIAFGGMATTPMRARKSEARLVGAAWSRKAVFAAADELVNELKPISDARGSAAYRSEIAANIMREMWPETRTSRFSLKNEKPVSV